MQYKPLVEITYDEALKLLKSEDEEILLLLSLRAGEYLEEWHQAQDICIRLMDHPSEKVRANAALGLAYTARTKGSLDKRIVKPYLLRELRENKECSWRVIDAINDINKYLGWHLAEKTLKEESSI